MLSSFNTDVDDYSLSEMMQISNIDISNITSSEIFQKTTDKINSAPNTSVHTFFKDIQVALITAHRKNELVNIANEMIEYESEDEKNNFERNIEVDTDTNMVESFSTLDSSSQRNPTQNTIFSENGNEHFAMKQGDIGIKQTVDVPVAQGTLNPTLKNTISRFVNLDSQFRPYGNNLESSTNYNVDLSDQLTNTLSLRLYSYEIPFTWYVFDSSRSNICLWVRFYDGTGEIVETVMVSIVPGNYSPNDFVTEINRAFEEAGFSNPTQGEPVACVTYNSNTGKLTVSLNGYTHSSYTVNSNTTILFHSNTLTCNNNLGNNSNYINRSLGWYMGFRETSVLVDGTGSGNTAEAVADFFGTKYIIMVVDDYNQNHVNNGLVTITETSNHVKLPNYYSADIPGYGIPSNSNVSESSSSDLIVGKQSTTYTDTSQLVPSAPRTLTNAQLYTINEINKNRSNTTNLKSRAPTNANILAIIPLKRTSFAVGTVITEMSGSLQDNIRTYFGPVNINKLRVKLLDDHGNVINMNGGEWGATLIATCLYQY
jgi:hypothetical protein